MSEVQMKRTVLSSLIGITLAISATLENAEARGREDRRQTRQSVRIQEGRASGELTKGEMKRVRASGKAIKKAEKRFENNDGEIGEKEAKALEAMQDARSKQIHRLKHNDRDQSSKDSQSDSQ